MIARTARPASTRRLRTAAVVGVVTAALIAPFTGSAEATPSSVQAAALPPGTFQTPTLPTTLGTWGAAGPVRGTKAGTLMGDGTIRTTALPSVAITLPPATRALVLAPAALGTGKPSASNDTDLVDGAITSTGATLDVTLWRLSMTTGDLTTRSVTGLPTGTLLRGATATAWVTTDATGGSAQVWPFDGSAVSTFTATDLAGVLAAGGPGIVFLARTATGDPAVSHFWIRLAKPDSTVVDVTDLGPRATTSPAPTAAAGSGAVGWCDATSGIGYWDAGSGASTLSAAAEGTAPGCPEVVVTAGAVAWRVNTAARYEFGGFTAWSPGSAHTVRPFDFSRVWPSATTAGAAGLAGVLVAADHAGTFAAAPAPPTESWQTWPVSTWLGVQVTPSPIPATPWLGELYGTVGHLATLFRSSYADSLNATGEVQLRDVSDRSVSLVTTVLHASGIEDGLPNPFRNVTVSGAYSSLLTWASTAQTGPLLVLRNGARVTATMHGVVPLARSGPIVLVSSPATGALAWAGSDGRRHPLGLSTSTVSELAISGSTIAYATADRRLWTYDIARARSSSNPHLIGRATNAVSYHAFWLSAGRLVLERADAHGVRWLDVIDPASGARRSVRLGSATCADMGGRLVSCWVSGRAAILDVGAAAPRLRLLSASVTGPVTFVGRLMAWGCGPDPTGGHWTRACLAPIPAAVGSVGAPRLLGPWSAYGATASRAHPARAWTPDWTLSEPLIRWTLTMRSASGRVVAVWHGTAPDGALRGVRWTARGFRLGVYRWTLTGSGQTGAPLNALGSGAPTGTVRVVA